MFLRLFYDGVPVFGCRLCGEGKGTGTVAGQTESMNECMEHAALSALLQFKLPVL